MCWGLKCQRRLALLWATLSPPHLSLAQAFVCTPWEENNPLASDHTWIQPSIWHLEKWANSLILLPGLKPEWMQLIFTALIRYWVSEGRPHLLENIFKNRERKGKERRKEGRQQERKKGKKRGRNQQMHCLKKRKESTEYLIGVTARETGSSPFLAGAGQKGVSYTDQRLEEHWGLGGAAAEGMPSYIFWLALAVGLWGSPWWGNQTKVFLLLLMGIQWFREMPWKYVGIQLCSLRQKKFFRSASQALAKNQHFPQLI